MRHFATFVLFGMVLLGVGSCKDKGDLLLPLSGGHPFEIMVVCSDTVWNGEAGRALNDVLNSDIPCLPQPERCFDVSHITPDQYNQITHLFRNIIVLNINPRIYTQTRMRYERDIYAQPQMILYINTPSVEDMYKSMPLLRQPLIDFFTKEEFIRDMTMLSTKHNVKMTKVVKSMFGCDLWVPVEMTSMKRGKDFLWMSNNTPSGLQNICVYSYGYGGNGDFTKKSFLERRDSIMRANIPGEQPDMFMHTDAITVQCRSVSLKGRFCFDARGLWEMENDCMGGPFVSHSVVDTLKRRVLVVEGFVYAPEMKKRTIMRNLESVLYTLSLPSVKKGGNGRSATADKHKSK